ncbi:MAG: DUF362 domain-containing protein [Candidatus Methanomethyliales bacterium]|nr:DUF362 domain-containing protein [Candidatus Methanomethylicales archaeon]
MVSEVYFLDLRKWRDALKGIDLLLSAAAEDIKAGERVAVKVHFGERGNYTYLRPAFVRRVVDFLKGIKASPFVTETTALYPTGFRSNAEEVMETARFNGFTEDGLGCPIVVADGPFGEDGVEVAIERAYSECRIKKISVARSIAESDALVVLSHVKGHLLSGFGGAIKHLGMGCTTKKGKREQHAAHGLVIKYERCTGCGECVKACRFSAMIMDGGHPVRDEEKCVYCNTCMFTCDQDAIELLEDGKERFQIALAHAAAGVMRALSDKPKVFLNFVMDVTVLCDCAAPAGNIITHNIGVLASKDPVAIDRASLDLIDASPIIPGVKASPPDPLGKLNGTDSTIQIKAMEALGAGRSAYRLVEV